METIGDALSIFPTVAGFSSGSDGLSSLDPLQTTEEEVSGLRRLGMGCHVAGKGLASGPKRVVGLQAHPTAQLLIQADDLPRGKGAISWLPNFLVESFC